MILIRHFVPRQITLVNLISLVVAIAALVSIDSCKRSAPSAEQADTPLSQSVAFTDPDFPFSFRYPIAYFQHASKSLFDARSPYPADYLEAGGHMGISVTQVGAGQYSTRQITDQIKSIAPSVASNYNVSQESLAGHEMVLFDADIVQNTNPPTRVHSRSYSFVHEGAVYKIEFYALSKDETAAKGAESLVMTTLQFRPNSR